jgi:hypothetical protein
VVEPAANARRGSRWRLRVLLALLTAGAVCGGAFVLYQRINSNPGCGTGTTAGTCTRIFFLGNSYTSVNDLPTTFADLAWSGGHRVEIAMQAPGGWTLADHDGSQSTQSVLTGSRWNLVVLQEQSEIPSIAAMRESTMYPAARDLVTAIRAAGARPMFFITWAHRNGWPENGMPDYFSMQSSIDTGYLDIAGEQHAAVSPVGYAWSAVYSQESSPDLWQDDGSHPTTKGTYLAACVFYAAIFRESPAGLGYHPWLSGADASMLQEAAAHTVLDDLAKWGLASS